MKKILPAVLALSLLAGCGTTAGTSLTDPGFPGAAAVRSTGRTAAGAIQGAMTVDGKPNGTMKPGQGATWGFTFADAAGNPITQFDQAHEKFMHLIAVSRDLSTFAHMHPTLGAGSFSLAANRPSTDPDNQDAARAVAKPGPFLLFGEVKPAGMEVQQARFTVTAEGQEQPTPLQLDPVTAKGEIVKYFTADGGPGKKGDPYQVTVSTMKMSGMVHVKFNLQAWMKMGGMAHYMPVEDLEPWLGMPGHAILISQTGEKAEDKIFRHLHTGDHAMMDGGGHGGGGHGGGTGPDVEFMLMGDGIPPAGVYKLWGQFKRQGKVVTFPFVLRM